MRRALPHEVKALLARLPAWWPAFARWSVDFANDGPRWLPSMLRLLPLRLVSSVCVFYARRGGL
jgi:hypothetical protein